MKEIENQQWAKLQQLENLRKGAEEDLKRTQIVVNAQRISEVKLLQKEIYKQRKQIIFELFINLANWQFKYKFE